MTKRDEILTEATAILYRYMELTWDGRYVVKGPIDRKDIEKLKQLCYEYQVAKGDNENE